jgi:hypothetical protein
MEKRKEKKIFQKNIHQPGFEPGFERWQRPVMTATLLMFEAGRGLPYHFLDMPFLIN